MKPSMLKGAARAGPGHAFTARDLLDQCNPAYEFLHGLEEDSQLTATRRALRTLAKDDAEAIRKAWESKGIVPTPKAFKMACRHAGVTACAHVIEMCRPPTWRERAWSSHHP